MITAFNVILLAIIVISFCGVIAELENKKLQENMAFVCAIAMAVLFASLFWL